MLIASDVAQLRTAVADGLEVGIVLDAADGSTVARAAEVLSLDVGAMTAVALKGVPRPSASVHEDQTEVVVFSFTAAHQPVGTVVVVSPAGLLAVTGDARGADLVRPALAAAADPAHGLAATVTAVARDLARYLATLADLAEDLVDQAAGFSSSGRRQQMGELRRRLLVVEHVCDAQHRLLTTDEVFADPGPAVAKQLRRAGADYAASAATASRLYAALGDALAEQRAVISERLTLVNAVFLPLSLGGAIFGMNFGWLGDHIGSATAFWALGVAAPVALMVATLLGIRRIGT